MRVLQVFNQYIDPGGEGIWVEKILDLVGEGIEVEELRFRSSEWIGDSAPSRLKQTRWIGDNPGSRERLAEAVGRFKPDILLYHNLVPVASFGLYDEARRLGVPVVQYLHNFRPFSPSGTLWVNGRVDDAALHGNPWPEIRGGAWNGSRLKTAIIAWHLARLRRSGALDAVRTWIAVSNFMREKMVQAGLPSERVVTLRHCWMASPEIGGVEEGDYYLFLGRLYESKGVRTLLDAWSALEERLGPRCPRLVIAGKGPLERDVQSAAGSSDHIEFAGFVDGSRKRDLLARCRALLAPSIWWEPLGLIVHEAYDHFRPVIASGSGGLAETVRAGETGLLHQSGDSESLAKMVGQMEEIGKEKRERMGRAGREWLESEASAKRWRMEFQWILESVGGQMTSSKPQNNQLIVKWIAPKAVLLGLIENHHSLYGYILRILMENFEEVRFISKSSIIGQLDHTEDPRLKVYACDERIDLACKGKLDLIAGCDCFIMDEYSGSLVRMWNIDFRCRRKLLIIHNANRWTKPITDPFTMDFYDQFFKKRFRDQFDAYMAIAPNVKRYLEKRMEGKKVFFLPFDHAESICGDGRRDRMTGNGISIVIPGTISSKRRNYEDVLNAFSVYLSHTQDPRIRLVMLGRISDREDQDIADLALKLNEKCPDCVKYWDSFVDQNEFDREICESDVILSNIHGKCKIGGHFEYYGISKESGISFVAYKFAKPAIIQEGIPILAEFESQLIRFERFSDLPRIFSDLECGAIDMETYRKSAMKNREQFNHLVENETSAFLDYLRND